MQIRPSVDKVAKYAIEELKDNGLISLYLAGTILDKEERTSNSDIDLFGIVESDFEMARESVLNSTFANEQAGLCGGFEVRFRAFPLCTLQGGKIIGVTKFFHPARVVQRFPFFKHIWGKKYNFKKDFLKPMKLQEEAKWLIRLISANLTKLRVGKETFPFSGFPKHVIELVRVEAQAEHGFKYDPARKKLAKHLKKEQGHIVHRIMELREKVPSRAEIIVFCDEVEEYIKDIKTKVVNWP